MFMHVFYEKHYQMKKKIFRCVQQHHEFKERDMDPFVIGYVVRILQKKFSSTPAC